MALKKKTKAKAAKPMAKSLYKKGGPVSVKGVATKGLTSRQATTLKKHSVHHTKKHIKMMVDAMKKGKSFGASHKIAQKKVGK
jgi:hypothetical protein|tara:strand:- start:1090 stop:1338 length:249 start_codon:yes stop_codon:yes gene_type:complete